MRTGIIITHVHEFYKAVPNSKKVVLSTSSSKALNTLCGFGGNRITSKMTETIEQVLKGLAMAIRR